MATDTPFLLSSWPNAIIHIDGDAFFASCEQSLHPELKGKPVVTGAERNIVASMSYEAKARGIKRAIGLWETKKICPDVVILPSDYETYSLISKRMFSIMRRFTPVVEESSIDEGYADIKGLRRIYRSGYHEIALQIQKTIERELGISISIGLSLTKTLSKLAAKYRKPHGFTAVSGRHIHMFLRHVPVGDVCGIGPNTTALLKKHSVITAYDYVRKSCSWYKQLLGKIGVELWQELRGTMIYALNPEEKTTYQSITKGKTFTPPSSDYSYIKAQLFRNVESACMKLRRYKLRTKRCVIYIKEQNFESHGMQLDLSRASNAPIELFSFIEEHLHSLYRPAVTYRATGVVFSCLEADDALQFELFEDTVRMIGIKKLSMGIDAINKQYGKHTVCAGTGLYLRRNQHIDPQQEGRHALPQRKKELLPGETARRRVGLPVWNVRV